MHYVPNLVIGWSSLLAGALVGIIIGLQFHRENWLGGYDSFPRRMVRLGHIAFFGLGAINILFAVCNPPGAAAAWASLLLQIGAVTMPACCFLTAWRKPCRHLFFIPAGSTTTGLLLVLLSFR